MTDIDALIEKASEWAGDIKGEYSDQGEKYILDLCAALRALAQENERLQRLMETQAQEVCNEMEAQTTRLRELEAERDAALHEGQELRSATAEADSTLPTAEDVRGILKERDTDALGRLWNAIVEKTKGDDLFWIGEILLAELEKETGFNPRKIKPA